MRAVAADDVYKIDAQDTPLQWQSTSALAAAEPLSGFRLI